MNHLGNNTLTLRSESKLNVFTYTIRKAENFYYFLHFWHDYDFEKFFKFKF